MGVISMKRFQADVAVIAAGPAGLAASIAAAENNAKVLVLEKSAATGGIGNMGMGPLGVETRMQRERLMDVTREKAFKIFMDYTHWRVDALLVKAYLDKSADTIEWLMDMGVEFTEPARFFHESLPTWHLVKPDSGRPGPQSASTMMRRMTERAKELGVQFLLETPATKIRRDNGRITGVTAVDKTGEVIEVDAKAVVVATGGFAGNKQWVREYTGFEVGKDLFTHCNPDIAGDGLRMAWEVGAGKTEMTMELNYLIPDNMGYFAIDAVMRQPNLMVNLSGERFLNEEIMGNGTFTGNAIARQKGRCAFVIMDESIKRHYRRNGLDLVSFVHGADIIDRFDSEIELALQNGYEHFFVADTIEELAQKTGIDSFGLKETIDRYNRDCKTRDTLFYKNYRYMRPIEKPKFYAARFFPSAYGSLGGIKINHRTEVLTQDFEVIPGLYAAGTDACSIFGDSYVFMLPGNTMGFALNSGRIAGENAAAYSCKD